jgi:hypothetical protein
MSLLLTEREIPPGYVSAVQLRYGNSDVMDIPLPYLLDPVIPGEMLPPPNELGAQIVITLTDPDGHFDSLSSHFVQTNPVGGFVDLKPILPNEVKILGTEGHAGLVVTGVEGVMEE